MKGEKTWESPIQMITDDIIKDITKKQDEWLMESVHRIGFNIDKDELVKALNYDRDQYEKGYADGRLARDSEIVRCKDCKYYNHRHHYCDGIEYWFGLENEWSDNGFCYKGERRDDGRKAD